MLPRFSRRTAWGIGGWGGGVAFTGLALLLAQQRITEEEPVAQHPRRTDVFEEQEEPEEKPGFVSGGLKAKKTRSQELMTF